jgi:hypothetical protein
LIPDQLGKPHADQLDRRLMTGVASLDFDGNIQGSARRVPHLQLAVEMMV